MSNEKRKSVEPKAESEEVKKTLDQLLAEIIGKGLVGSKFTTAKKREALEAKIATGQMTAEDWRTLAAASMQAEASKKAIEKAKATIDSQGGDKNG